MMSSKLCTMLLDKVAERRSSGSRSGLDLFLGVADGADFGRQQVGDTNHTTQFAYRLLRRTSPKRVTCPFSAVTRMES